MIFEYFGQLNWLAIVVATLAWFAFSAIWYSVPPLSKAWQQAARVTPDEGPPLAAILVPTAIGYFVTTVVIALLAKGLGASTIGEGLGLGVALGIGLGMVSALIVQLYEQKGGSYWLINGVNSVIALSIVGMILAVWN
jgi:hypothetical protein